MATINLKKMKKIFTIFGLLALIGSSSVLNAQWLTNNSSWITNSQDVTNPTNLLDNDDGNSCSISITHHTEQWGSIEITFAQETCIDSLNYKWTKRDHFYDYSPGVASWFATKLYYYNEDSLDWILVVADTLDNSMDNGSVATHTGWSLKSFAPVCATKFKFDIGSWWWWTNNITFSIHELYLHQTSQTSENCNFINNSATWLNSSDITDASNIIDNDLNTNGYLSMSNYSTTYTKDAILNFPSAKSISSFKFKYSFPTTTGNNASCTWSSGNIAATCKVKLYYDNGSGWTEAYTVLDNLPSLAPIGVCDYVDSAQFDFANTITAADWKIEMIGNYWLGGSYQSTTFFKLFEVNFKECMGGCVDTLINDTITYFVADNSFSSISPVIYFEGIDSLNTLNGGCDSIIYHFTEYVFDGNYCTDTIEVFDTTYVTVYDSISVTDTLIIDCILTGIAPPNNINTLRIYPNPASDYVIINTGDYIQMTSYNLKIENTLGQTVFENLINQSEFQINVNDFGGYGTYFVKIYDDLGTLLDTKKLILQ